MIVNGYNAKEIYELMGGGGLNSMIDHHNAGQNISQVHGYSISHI